MMTTKQAADILAAYNRCRRDDHEPCPPPYSPTDIGIAIDMAVELMQKNSAQANLESIIMAVSRETGVSEAEMCQRGREREYSEARAIVSYLAYRFTPMTLTAIGKRFGRTHATTIYYYRTVLSWLHDKRLNPRGHHITNSLINEIISNEQQS